MAKTTVHKIQQVAIAALNDAETLVAEWLPDGARQGSEWVARNTARDDQGKGSFGVSLASGKWNDFADPDAHGGDLVSLLSYLRGFRQVDAAMMIDQRLGLGIFHRNGEAQASPPIAVTPTKNQLRQQAEAQRLAAQQKAAQLAKQLWLNGQPACLGHTYLVSKGISPYRLRQTPKGQLMVPLYADGELVNVQLIDAQGNKRFLKGGQVLGAYSPLGRVMPGKTLYVCEGWATGATIHAHTREPVACAMHAGNLEPVARGLCERYGHLEMVIAGDDDRATPGNPGRTAANAAALAVGALVLFPAWPKEAPHILTDFNDLACWYRQQGGHHE